MLQPGVIPNTEPTLNVGIVLPEDRYASLNIVIPKDIPYQLEFSSKTIVPESAETIHFELTRDGISFRSGEEKYLAPDIAKIGPLDDIPTPAPRSGIKLKEVISGRDFHWRKYIDVTLSGNVILKPHENNLLVINELPIEQYLACVATSEMGAACPPALIEAIG